MRRWLVWGAWISGVVVGAPLAALALVYALSDTAIGERTIAGAIGLLSAGEVRITGLAGEFPRHLRIAHLEVADEKGVWLTIDNLALDWSPFRLFRNRADIASAAADRLAVLRLPVTKKTSAQSTFRTDIARLSIARADLGPALVGHPMSVSLAGRIHYVSAGDASWNVSVARLGGTGTLVSDGNIDRGAINANAVLKEPSDSVAAGLAGLPNLGPLMVDLHVNGPRQRELVALTAHAGVLFTQAHGAVDLRHDTALVDVEAHSGAMEPRPGFAWKSVEFQGHVQGRFVEPTVAGHLMIAELRAAGGSVASLSGDVDGRGGRVALTARAVALKLPGAQPLLFAGAPVDFKLLARLDTPKPHFDFALGHPLVQANGDVTLGVAPLAHAVVNLPNLDPLSRLAGLSLAGAARLRATGTMNNDIRHVSADLALDARGQSLLARLLGRTHAVFTATSSEQGLALDDFHLNGQGIAIAARGRDTPELRNFSYEARLASLSSLSGNLSGSLALHGTVLGKPENFAFTLGASGSAATRGYAPEPIEVSLRANGLPSRPQGQVDVSGRLDRSPLRIEGRFDGSKNAPTKVDIPTADWRSLKMNANLVLTPSGRPMTGKSSLSVGELGDLGALIGVAMRGSVTAAIDLTSGRSGQSALVHA
ncbi:MAG: hypothetical protein JOZ55_05140, partial [Alphaproteobacteria bacterium]|nr:hypothetical protein [Alphaproteobacteria bacterium]